jgi:hypothetical protein
MVIVVSYFYPTMEVIHQAIRLNYTRISEGIQAELTFLSELSELTDDERFRQSVAEVIYGLNDLFRYDRPSKAISETSL